MGGRGASSGNIATLNNRLSKINNEVKETEKRIQELSKYAMPGNPAMFDSNKQSQYYNERNKLTDLRKKQEELRNNVVKQSRKNNKKKTKTFVNSYGEATNREITSTTYKRAMARQEKRVRRNLGI